jgi:hypothetical protein
LDKDLGLEASSLRHAARLIIFVKKSTGLGFTDYVAHARLEDAKTQLLNPDRRISEFAYDVGFQSLTQFNRSFKRNVGPQVRPRRYALGWLQSVLAAKLQIADFDISRSGMSKIEARLSYVDDNRLLYLTEVLKVQLQELFPTQPPGNRIYDLIEKLETTRFWRV